MAEKSTTATRIASEPEAKGSRREATPFVPLGLTGSLFDLQTAVGNRGVHRLLGRALLQPKLRIGPAGDAHEREADRVADAILRNGPTIPISEAGGSVQRMCPECEEELVQRMCKECQEEEEEELLQPKADGAPPSTAGPAFEARLGSLRGSGRPLPADLRSFFEPRFGHDFAAVRVHTGGAAGEAAQAVSARAFTVGNDVVFGTGEWSPESTAGKRLLAHELTHVVQQTPLVARRKPLLQRAPEDGAGAPQTGPAEEGTPAPSPGPPATAPETPTPESETPAAEQASAAVVVEDEAADVGEGQMTKSAFLARLRTDVCAAAEAGLAGTEHSAQGCPMIEFWIGYYERQDVERINRDLPRFAGEGARPTTAEGYITLITERVRASVTTWARTGEITGVPPGIPLPGMGLPGLGGFGGLFGGLGGLGGIGSVFFKARPGGARDPGDPAALQARLGAGRPLDGGIRSRMESAFGRSFSHVRIHTDGSAAGLSTRFNARAFTVGHHVAFGPQEYRPGTMIGDALIAHELAHVAQQGDAGAAGPVCAKGTAYQALERDADLATVGAVAAMWTGLRGRLRSFPRPEPRLTSGLRLQRCDRCALCSPEQTTATPATTPGPEIPEIRMEPSCPPKLQDPSWQIAERPLFLPRDGCSLLLAKDAGNDGMKFTGRIDVAPNCAGQVYFVQLVKVDRSLIGCPGGSTETGFCTKKPWGIDTNWPYPHGSVENTGQLPSTSKAIHTRDTPGHRNVSNPDTSLARICINDEFVTYLVYENSAGQLTPLGWMHWKSSAQAVRDSGNCPPTSTGTDCSGWRLLAGRGEKVAESFVPGNMGPQALNRRLPVVVPLPDVCPATECPKPPAAGGGERRETP